jgi:asparagine synthase (glutamine-hydrolysing)
MCGIAGIVGRFDGRDALVGEMTARLVHRGPDDQGFWSSTDCAFGHRRLSIIDLSANGRQPMANEDGTVQVTYNGEIYNFAELRPGLEAAGHRFRSNTDTEVLVHLYEERGEAFLEALRGMFAVALWDERKRRLLLARDHFGQKPLFWAQAGDSLYFASEIKALLACPAIPREPDPQAIDEFLTLHFVPAPRTTYRAIRRLPAASRLVFEPGGQPEVRRWWRADDAPTRSVSAGEAMEEADHLLRRAVREQLVADVPVGVLLSGGIDSSVVLAAATDEGARGIDAFTIGFEESAYSEVPYARRAADTVGATHHLRVMRADDARDPTALLEAFDEPFADVAAIPTMALCRGARERVKVALTGDGGDEIFGGYQYHVLGTWMARLGVGGWARERLARATLRLVPSAPEFRSRWRIVKRGLEALTHPDWHAATVAARATLDRAGRDALYVPVFHDQVSAEDPYRYLDADPNGTPTLDRLFRTSGDHVLADELLHKTDIASMTASLECRSPFLDVRLATWTASLPLGLKVRGMRGKVLLRRLAARRYGPEIWRRRKQGFTMPLDRWLKGELRPLVMSTLLDPGARVGDYVRREGLARLWREHDEGRADHRRILWACLVLELWLRRGR